MGGGYTATSTNGGRAVISGNTCLQNRHCIASDGEPHSEYRAWYNLVLSDVPFYNGFECGGITCIGYQQDFDMHGTRDGYHTVGGYSVDIAGNTFLGGNRPNFELRGHPVSTDYFRDNVTQQDSGGAIHYHNIDDPQPPLCVGPDGPSTPVTADPGTTCSSLPVGASQVLDYSNQFSDSNPPFTDPTAQLAVGDFDGDGRDDLFLATGTAWYYSPAGSAEWRFLSAKTDRMGQLLFGDFDGDGRADVAAIHGGQLVVSWGGASDWEVLNRNPLPSGVGITDMVAGKFLDHPVGDKRYDIFSANNSYWYLSYGGSEAFNQIAGSRFGVKDLRFGDFNGDGKTDVFSVQSTGWQVSYATGTALADWTGWPSPSSPATLTSVVDGLYVGDFLGVGRATVAMPCGYGFTPGSWCIAEGAPAFWHPYSFGLSPLYITAIGHFGGQTQIDLLLWNAKNLSISAGGISQASPWSSQEMR